MAAAVIGLLVAIGAIVAGAGRGNTAEVAPTRATGSAPRAWIDSVVLVTIDGVRHQEIFGGIDPKLADKAHLPEGLYAGREAFLPNITRLFFGGGTVIGDPGLPGGIRASGPHYVSLPGYVELSTGSPSACRGNSCDPELGSSLTDEIAGLELESQARDRVAVFSSWDRIAVAATNKPQRITLSTGRTTDEPAFPGVGDYRPDHFTASAAMAYLSEHRPRFLWVALGDTDEWAHRCDYRGYVEALRAADDVIGQLAAELAKMESEGARTALFVTTDHGRDAGFCNHGGLDSAAVFLLARGSGLPQRGRVSTAQLHHLRDIAPTLRTLLGLAPRACETCGAPISELLPAPR